MKPGAKTWTLVLILSATATASYICRVNVSTAAPLLMKEFNLDQVRMGRVFSAFLLGYALFQIPAGALADRWGARRVLAVAAWLWVGLTVLQTIVGCGPFQTTAGTTLMVFMACRMALGIAEAPTFPGAAQGVSRWVAPPLQGRANGIVIGAIGVGSAIAPPLVSHVMVHFGWRTALIVSALPALIMAIVWQRITAPPGTASIPQTPAAPGDTPAPAPASPAGSSRLFQPGFIFLTLSYTLQGYVGYIFVSWFYLYLVQERNFDLLKAAWMSSLPWILSIISIPLGGFISDRLAAGRLGQVWGRRAVPIFGMTMSGILISIGAHTGSAIIAAISLAFATAFVLCVEGPFWTAMMNIAGRRSGTAGGIMNMGSNLGGLISPALTPILARQIGWENALHVAAGLSIVAALLWFAVRPVPTPASSRGVLE
ncbi:MAG: MFS transporter [Verrucomicrobiota bacterium]|jgi:ACS family glucarate transporter-like MFS transporter